MAVKLRHHKFTADQYLNMAEAGVLRHDDRVELIEGEIVDMAPIGNRHNSVVDCLAELFHDRLEHAANVRVQGSIRLNEKNQPQPDLVLLRRRADFYASGSAMPGDTLLVIEVADTTLAYDR